MGKTYHIIGAGISGLYTAMAVKERNPEAYVVVYESASHAGGRCFSFFSPHLGVQIDNATHAFLGGNSNIYHLTGKPKLYKHTYFFDLAKNKLSRNIIKNFKEICLAVFNLALSKTPLSVLLKTSRQLFPFFGKNLSLYYSQNNLSEKVIHPLVKYADEIKFGYTLRSVETKDTKLTKLKFQKDTIEINDTDIVISALDAYNYDKIFGGNSFEFNPIINIFYRTSTKLTLPKDLDYLGISNGLAQWIFVNDTITSVTISDATQITLSDQELAIKVWKEICQVRGGRAAAFLPPYQVIYHKRATIKQDKKNNALRPTDCKTLFDNLFIAGDWTMKNFPSSLEASILSAKRAAKKSS